MSINITQTDRIVGKVKWFNNKAGYGFITVSEGEQTNKDIFVHYSNIRVSNSQYKYLVQGEYVEFVLEKTVGGSHEFQAIDVTGIKCGSIMCETRQLSRDLAPVSDKPRTRVQSRPLVKRDENEGFTTVSKKTRV